jgi:hypothetical protein
LLDRRECSGTSDFGLSTSAIEILESEEAGISEHAQDLSQLVLIHFELPAVLPDAHSVPVDDQ